MDISGIVLACLPEHLAEAKCAVSALSWATVRHEDPKGRLVVVIEAADVQQSQARLLELQKLPRILSAQLAAYFPSEDFEDERGSHGVV